MIVETADDRTVGFDAHNHFAATDETVIETQVLVFRSRAEIEADLRRAGFDVERVQGEWTGGQLEDASRSMIFVARAR